MALVVILSFLLPLGLACTLIISGVRGFRVGDHPVCRRCGFDLFGSPAGTAVCGECGSDLSKRKAIVIGHKLRRRKALGFGAALLMLSMAGLAIEGYGRAKHVNWWSHAPLWYLLRGAGSTDANRRRSAIAELEARLADGRLAQADLNRVFDVGLAYQGDVHRVWDSNWGDLIEDAIDAGKVSADRVERYAKQAVSEPIKFWVDSQIRMGDVVSWHVDIPASRLARYSNFETYDGWSPEFPDDRPGPNEWGPAGGGGGFCRWTAWDGDTRNRHNVSEGQHEDGAVTPIHPLQPGKHRIVLHWTRSTDGMEKAKLKASVETQQDLMATFEVMPAPATNPVP
jgi:hypothetical protein